MIDHDGAITSLVVCSVRTFIAATYAIPRFFFVVELRMATIVAVG